MPLKQKSIKLLSVSHQTRTFRVINLVMIFCYFLEKKMPQKCLFLVLNMISILLCTVDNSMLSTHISLSHLHVNACSTCLNNYSNILFLFRLTLNLSNGICYPYITNQIR